MILSFFVTLTYSTSVNIYSYLYSRLLDECTRENARTVTTDSEDTQSIDEQSFYVLELFATFVFGVLLITRLIEISRYELLVHFKNS